MVDENDCANVAINVFKASQFKRSAKQMSNFYTNPWRNPNE